MMERGDFSPHKYLGEKILTFLPQNKRGTKSPVSDLSTHRPLLDLNLIGFSHLLLFGALGLITFWFHILLCPVDKVL